jgi:gas vesicle protein
MQYNDRGGTSALAIGAVVGALVAGAAVGVLTAPESGAYTRRRIRRGLADLGGTSLRDRWGDLSAGISRRREQREHSALVRRLEARVAQLEEQLAAREEQEEGEEQEEQEEQEERSGSAAGSVLSPASSALLTWFLTSDSAEPARKRAREVAGRAKVRAGDEWERFKAKRGPYRRQGDRIVPEAATGTSGEVYQ